MHLLLFTDSFTADNLVLSTCFICLHLFTCLFISASFNEF